MNKIPEELPGYGLRHQLGPVSSRQRVVREFIRTAYRYISIFGSVFVLSQISYTQNLAVVDSIDLRRYAGTWYEIARLPNRFQGKCLGNVTATYTLLEDGDIMVVNRCLGENGEYTEAEGLARRANSEGSNAKLKVRFAPSFLSFLPFVWGDYWVIDLAPDYSYAVVGEPNREYLWILSRTPTMDENILSEVLRRVSAQGYDLSRLMRTKQTN